ncbi:MAG: hypothetical protein ACRD3I_05235 [Terriglobales bacterium]
MTVLLGFEVGTGKPVEIPTRHMAITGQTQEAGKTTALEALIARSELRAITFITTRGEGSFTGAHRIPPYFREQADWQFVASILEASRGEKLKFERAWIIRASKGASTLAGVQRNVKKAMETAKGMSADVYLTLDAYLEAVVPQIGAVRWAPDIRLSPGVNAMDLTALNVEMQHLVIRSALDWVLNRESNTVVVVPEAWKFIPQGRGTPVKLAAESLIRQGAGLKNYLWLDSQDIAGIEKIILKSVPVWILGVQREANEIKRTLDNIPAGISKPSKADIATLELGQFYACWGRHAIKVYVQPAWMDGHTASLVARGERAIDKEVKHLEAVISDFGPAQPSGRAVLMLEQEGIVDEREAQALRDENQELKVEVARLTRRLNDLAAAVVLPSKPLAKEEVRLSGAQRGGKQHALDAETERVNREYGHTVDRSADPMLSEMLGLGNGVPDYDAFVARLLADLGHLNVGVLQGGWEAYRAAGLPEAPR